MSAFSPFSPKAAMTSARALKLLLMLCVSFRRSLSLPAPLLFKRSEPARSTRFRDPSHDSPLWEFAPEIRRVNTEWERDDRSFIKVEATVRRE